ncbi:protein STRICTOSIDINE SYNTHASE-LIKE 4-like [Impatiens glandulifera]|uniref:protein STRICTOSIDINE SYNTHASE-LIKE 4-like n=1 Tax=Impatiens glandulifera TaxID=253017 RepID=UPI001FB14106|nr:protein STRICTOSIDINE SYNTHASE-LIKE 4-like [Impatiens glandulifera]
MRWLSNILLLWVAAPTLLSVVIFYQLESFEPAQLPIHDSLIAPTAPNLNLKLNILRGVEKVGTGKIMGPEDVAYDAESKLIYTGCADGWIKRVRVDDLSVEDWVNSGGRPLGLVLGPDKRLIVADANKGLLRVNENVEVEVLTDEAEGVKFGLTNGVDASDDKLGLGLGGTIYFTDASYKYRLKDFIWDMLEGRPYGRLLSYDPSTNQTKILLSDLYFPNGVALSQDQTFLVFCETPLRRCMKYMIEGEGKGTVEKFIDVDGFPDNIQYDRIEGVYWIGLASVSNFNKKKLRF